MRQRRVVDDDDVSRRGLSELLSDLSEIEVIPSLTHAEARAWNAEWGAVVMVIVDAGDERLAGDQFPGVAVVE